MQYFDGSGADNITASDATLPTNVPFSISFRMESSEAGRSMPISWGTPFSASGAGVFVDLTGGDACLNNWAGATSGPTVCDGSAHNVCIICDGSGNVSTSVDGGAPVSVGSTSFAPMTPGGVAGFIIGGLTGYEYLGWLANVAVWGSALSSADAEALTAPANDCSPSAVGDATPLIYYPLSGSSSSS